MYHLACHLRHHVCASTCVAVSRVDECEKQSFHERMLARGQGEQVNLPAISSQRSPTSAGSTQSEGTSSKNMPARRSPAVQSVQPLVSKQPKTGHGTTTALDTTLPPPWEKQERFCLYTGWPRRTLLKFSTTHTETALKPGTTGM